MLSFGPLSFAAPWALAGLLTLPALWLLLRATPPAPKRAVFPPLRLLRDAPDDNETPHHAPWWLILFRLLIAALIIIGLARPVWTPPAVEVDDRPILIVMDNGWASATAWSEMERLAARLIDDADRDGRSVALAMTAPAIDAPLPLRLDSADSARRLLSSAEPQAWFADRAALAERIDDAIANDALTAPLAVTWLSNGLTDTGARDLAAALNDLGSVRVIEPDTGRAPLAIDAPEATTEGLRVTVRRAAADLPMSVDIVALGQDGRAIARAPAVFDGGSGSTSVDIALPLDLRNRIASLRVDARPGAGSVRLLGDRWQRPRVGLIEANADDGQPLLSDLHYVESAISPVSVPYRGELDALLEEPPAVLVMVDDARSDDERISDFVLDGGLLIRFAGPRLAARGDDLLPVDLRQGGRLLGGALNWEEPQRMAAFGAQSPFAGLPADASATIDSQVLAEPGSATPDRVWARLEDGTPLVTAQRRGRGWIVLFHVTAGPTWSDLPLSGLFPRMLERVLGLAEGGEVSASLNGAWSVSQALDAGGQLANPPVSARPIPAEAFSQTRVSPSAPPGLYRLGAAVQALNTVPADFALAPLPRDLPGAVFAGFDGPRPFRFETPLLVGALIMMILDVLIALGLAGRLRLPFGATAAAVGALLFLPVVPHAEAQDADAYALEAALDLRFAYVATGVSAIDSRSRAGLIGLSQQITRRSAMEPGTPMAINPETDELIFFPMIYWPVERDAAALSEEAASRITAYLQGGGLIIFDTQDADVAALRAGAPHPGLITILDSIDVPPLAQISSDHVLTRSFYLLQEFPGRFSGSPVWVEANPDGASRDGTSGVIIGAHDWASAWAVDENGRPMAPVDGGERQRELAQRFGINVAMYALTGNYKADQVHIPDILERLGQ